MVAHVARKHWWIQFPISWGVEVVLVLALLASVGFGVAQVRSRDATIADQAAGIGQQAATVRQSEKQLLILGTLAEVDSAIVEAYSKLAVQRITAMDQARRGDSGEVYESIVIAEAAVMHTQRHIADLLAQRHNLLAIPTPR